MKRSIWMSILLSLILLAGMVPANAKAAAPRSRFFPETGIVVSDPVLAAWEKCGLAICGLPLTIPTPERLEDGHVYTVQYFERSRFELHPENKAPYDVLLGQLGRLILSQATIERLPKKTCSGLQFFDDSAPTGTLCMEGRFRSFWETNGGLQIFGYPLTNQVLEVLNGKTYTVQYFERARLELHPENPAPYDILLGQFGRRIVDSRQGPEVGNNPGASCLPTYESRLHRPGQIWQMRGNVYAFALIWTSQPGAFIGERRFEYGIGDTPAILAGGDAWYFPWSCRPEWEYQTSQFTFPPVITLGQLQAQCLALPLLTRCKSD